MSFKKIFLWLLLVLLFKPTIGNSQDLYFVNNDSLIMSGGAQIILQNTSTSKSTSINNNKYFQCNNSSLVDIISYGPAFIGGTKFPTFRNLTVDLKSTNPASPNILTLNQTITVLGNLTFASDGLIELNGKIITLGSNASGQIVNETNTARITGINGGTVSKMVNMSSPNPLTNVNFGNIGLVLSTTANLGNVTVFRGHVLQTNSTGNGFAGVYRYYDVRPTLNPAGNNITVKFNYLDAEVTKAPVDYTNSKDQLTLWNNQESTRGFWLLTDRDSYDATNNWVLKAGIPTLTTTSGVNYRFTLSSTTTKPLPVKLLNFSGKIENNQSLLNWTIMNDGSLSYFELQHSSDGNSFSKVVEIASQPSTQVEQYYQYIDIHPFTPVTFYRLKTIDKSQAYFYSNIVRLSTSNASADIYPNPASDAIYLAFTSETSGITSIQLFNAAGQLITSKNISYSKGENKIQLSIEQYPKGLYIIKSADLNLQHNSFIKN